MSPTERAERMAAQAARVAESSFPWVTLIGVSLFVSGLIWAKMRGLNGDLVPPVYMKDKKVVPGQPGPGSFSALIPELVQDASLVLRHNSTRGMDRVMDRIASAAEAIVTSIRSFTKSVRSRQRKKDASDDVDLLNVPPSLHPAFGNSIVDLGKGDIDSIQMDDELAQFVDEVANEGTAGVL